MAETYELQFGDLDWSPAAQVDDVQVRVFGLRRGKAVPVVQIVESLIQDGGLEQVERFENRDQQIVLAIDASDSQALAEYESTLFREVQKVRNELRYTPPDGFAPAGVFDVLWADLTFADDDALWDLDEVMRGRRNYILTLRCLPFARSVDPFTVTGVTSAVSPSTVTLSDGSTTTGWSSSGGSAVTSDGSSVSMPIGFAANSGYPNSWVSIEERLRLTGTFDMSATTFVQVDVTAGPLSGSGGGSLFELPGVVAFADGVQLTRLAESASPIAGFRRVTFTCPDALVSEFAFAYAAQVDGSTSVPTGPLAVTSVARTNVAPSIGTLRQKTTAVEIPGSARTPASLVISHPSSGLGHVLAYTGPALGKGYSPALSPFRAAGATMDATTVSGSYATGADTFDAPATSLPSGQYQLVARTRATAASATAQLRIGSTNVGLVQSPGAGAVMGAADADSYYLVALGSFFLPPHEVGDNSSAVVRVSVTAAASRIDEVWAFYLPDDNSAALSYVPVGTARRLWLNAATVNRPYPSALVGTAADGGDAFGADGSTSNWSEHQFPAGSNDVFVVTTSALDAQVSATGFARWHTHPAA